MTEQEKSTLELCYAVDGMLYFTEDLEEYKEVSENDIPYVLSGYKPYEDLVVVRIAFMTTESLNPLEWGILPNLDDDIDDMPLLYHPDADGLYIGDSMEKCIEWLRTLGLWWGELHK